MFSKFVVLSFVLSVGVALAQDKPSPSIPKQHFGSPFKNIPAIAENLGFNFYYSKAPAQRVKIAVFDYGFFGYEDGMREGFLPQDLQFVKSTLDADPNDLKDPHGTYMAEIVQALMTNEGRASQFAPQFYFYYVSGHTNFRDAITDAIAKNVDIILYPTVREFGSNGDGKGFWNKEVNRATAAGIVWVNAAGNYGRLTYNSQIATANDGLVRLPDQNDSLTLNCNPGQVANNCRAKIILSWNDFKDDAEVGTNKDLDLALLDSSGKIIGQSLLKQVEKTTGLNDGSSLYPREMIDVQLDPGSYAIQVRDNSKNFTSSDRMRILVDGEFLSLSHYETAESLQPPADNPTVITVGAQDSERTAVSVKLLKPELITPSSFVFNNNDEYLGSSNSAAIVTAGFGILKSFRPDLNRQALLNYTSSPAPSVRFAAGPRPGALSSGGAGPTMADLGIKSAYPGNCIIPVTARMTVQPYLADAMSKEGIIVQTGPKTYKIMINVDPITLGHDLKRADPSDAVMATPLGNTVEYKVISRNLAELQLRSDVEIFEKPSDGPTWCDAGPSRNGAHMNSEFWLPKPN